jgi:hypothetical protein
LSHLHGISCRRDQAWSIWANHCEQRGMRVFSDVRGGTGLNPSNISIGRVSKLESIKVVRRTSVVCLTFPSLVGTVHVPVGSNRNWKPSWSSAPDSPLHFLTFFALGVHQVRAEGQGVSAWTGIRAATVSAVRCIAQHSTVQYSTAPCSRAEQSRVE